MRINAGCGQTPTRGWRNFDNSLSLRFARIPLLPDLLHRLRVLDAAQYQFIRFAREHDVEYGDAIRGLPVAADSCDVLYSSHMLEHLDRSGADRFLREARRVLQPGGVIRIAVPDIRKYVEQYGRSGNADDFIEGMHVCVPQPVTLVQKLRWFLVGARHHLWMYDGQSLARLLKGHGFIEVAVLPEGSTGIPQHEPLDLRERSSESVYVEAKKSLA